MGRKNEAYWIEKRKLWKIQVQKDGERKTFYSSTIGKVGKIEAEKKADAWLEIGDIKKEIRLSKAWEEYLEEVELLKSRSEYIQTEQLGRLWILPKLKHKFLRNISDLDWQKCINDAYKKGKFKKTLMNIRGKITNFCKFARKARYMDQPPIDLVIPKDAPVKKRGILQPNALLTLLEKDYELWRGKPRKAFYINAFRFDVAVGLRRGELCGLKWTDIKGRKLYLRRAINYLNEETSGKNENAPRDIILSKLALNILEKQKQLMKDRGLISPYIFPHEEGSQVNPQHVYDAWKRYRKTHDLQTDIQGLRRTLVSFVKNDMPEETAKLIIGHSEDMDTYGVYGREVDGELEAAADIIDRVFERLLNQQGKDEDMTVKTKSGAKSGASDESQNPQTP